MLLIVVSAAAEQKKDSYISHINPSFFLLKAFKIVFRAVFKKLCLSIGRLGEVVKTKLL